MKKDENSVVLDLVLKFASESAHVCKVFESCQTIEQVENTNKWACSIMDRWYWLSGGYGLFLYYDKLRPMIKAASVEMEKTYEKAKERVLEA